jgi:predicted ATPase
MFNTLVETFIEEIAKKTGKPSKPTKTGFREYASNRIKIEKNVNKIDNNINKRIKPKTEYVGNLGDKGELYCKTEIVMQNGSIANSNFSTISNINKTPQKEFSNKISKIKNNIYTVKLFKKISELKSIDDIDNINDLDDLLLFNKYFTINDELYKPSNGESSMLLLHKELSEDKEVYLLDEPEKSLGNDYISEVIVPILKEKAKMGKKIIIATHDANIAVRTLPYNSIYRTHEKNKYNTYIGNPFSNNLVNIHDSSRLIKWKKISMKTLEGGQQAFGERGKIYGSS